MTADSSAAPLARRLLAEGLGTAVLVSVVIGSGQMATTLTDDVALQLLANSLTTVLGLGLLIWLLAPVSGAHLNPIVTAVVALTDRRPRVEALAYVLAQLVGGVAGALLANAMFDLAVFQLATTERTGAHLWLAEVVATAGLVTVVLALGRTARPGAAPVVVAAWIGAAYWFTSSTSFANPAVTLGRVFSDTFAGIAPASVPAFVLAQIVGGAVAVGLVRGLFGPQTRPSQPWTASAQRAGAAGSAVNHNDGSISSSSSSTGAPDVSGTRSTRA